MSQDRPDRKEIAGAIYAAERAVERARLVRARYRRRRTPQRDDALLEAQQRCIAAAEPLRSWLGMVAWGGIDLEDELAMKAAMAALRYERRQIGKML